MRTSESHHPAWLQGQFLTRCRIPPPPWCLLIHAEFAEPADENILSPGQGGLDGLQHGFNETDGFGFGNAEAVLKGTSDLVFGESHGRAILERWVSPGRSTFP